MTYAFKTARIWNDLNTGKRSYFSLWPGCHAVEYRIGHIVRPPKVFLDRELGLLAWDSYSEALTHAYDRPSQDRYDPVPVAILLLAVRKEDRIRVLPEQRICVEYLASQDLDKLFTNLMDKLAWSPRWPDGSVMLREAQVLNQIGPDITDRYGHHIYEREHGVPAYDLIG